MPRRVEDYRGLAQTSRVKLLHEIQRVPGQKLDELAAAVGLHINTARDHLKVLEDEGLVASRPITTGCRGRPPVVFESVQAAGVNPRADSRAADSQAKGDLLRRIYPILDKSHAIGIDAQHQIDTLYTHLEDVGLEPELDEDALGLTVVPCMQYDLIDGKTSAVCVVHARLIQDQLSQVDGPLQMEKLQPFVAADQCRVTLKIHSSREQAEQAEQADNASGASDEEIDVTSASGIQVDPTSSAHS